MRIGSDHAGVCDRRNRSFGHLTQAIRAEWRSVVDDLGTVLLAGFCLAGAIIVMSTFDGDLQGSDEVVAAILGTLSLFAILAGLELADRLKRKRTCRKTL